MISIDLCSYYVYFELGLDYKLFGTCSLGQEGYLCCERFAA